jgi:hypothetical protein
MTSLLENARIMLSRVEAIQNCPEAMDALCAEDCFGAGYKDLLAADAASLTEAIEKEGK